ncbi:MAG TPA: hypothetical protein VF488_00390 [Gemmatimonadaceae bacterium]
MSSHHAFAAAEVSYYDNAGYFPAANIVPISLPRFVALSPVRISVR